MDDPVNLDELDNEVMEEITPPVECKNKIVDMELPEPIIYGREDDKKKIIELLVSDEVNFICVVSDRGIGKTTILQVVYNNESVYDSFDTRLFISMPENFDEKMLIRMIIESLTCASCDVTELETLEKILKEELDGKKFILVLDNFDNKDPKLWNIPLMLLNLSSYGSVVMVSIRRETVSDMRTHVQCYYYDLDPLSDHSCRMIFRQYALCGQDTDNDPNLAEIGKQLVTKCANNTLCIKVLSCLLRQSKKKEWMKIVSKSSSCEMHGMDGDILPSLMVCYNALPPHLKRCFEYFSLYPKGYLFAKHHLVLMWLSQGLIVPINGRELEEIGLEYFDELVSRSFFQHSPFHKTKGVFVMCGLIHDMAQHVSIDKFFRLQRFVQRVPENACHLSLVPHAYQVVSLKDLITKTQNLQSFLVVNIATSQLESFTSPLMHLGDLDHLFKKCYSLATLDLSNTDIKQLPNSIGLLKALHYLGLNGTNIKCIPSEISNLISLETLEAQNCHYLEELPQNIQELTNLRHLDVNKESGLTIMPSGIRKLTNLRSLPVFNIGIDQCGIEELESLVYLRGNIHISGLENVRSGKDAKAANLINKIFLENLCLHWNEMIIFDEDDKGVEIAQEVLQNLEPSCNLQGLIIRNYPGTNLPMWSESFPNLVSIILDNCYNCKNLPDFGEFPFLKYLSIQKMFYIQKINLFNRCPSLEVLNIWEMYGLEEWADVKEGDFPVLHTLCINRCQFLRNIPCFRSLVELSIYNCTQLPVITELPSLESLKIEGLQKVESIELPKGLPGLKKLDISHCPKLQSVKGLPESTYLEKIKIIGCPNLDMSKNQPSLHLKKNNNTSILNQDKDNDSNEQLCNKVGSALGTMSIVASWREEPGLCENLSRLDILLLQSRKLIERSECWRFKYKIIGVLLPQLKDAADEAQSMLDEFSYQELKHKVESPDRNTTDANNDKIWLSDYKKKVKKVYNSLSNVCDQLKQACDDHNIPENPNQFSKTARLETTSFITEQVFGRVEEMKKVISLMGASSETNGRSREITVEGVGLTGSSGVDKTNLEGSMSIPAIVLGISAAGWLISPTLSRLINKGFDSLGKDVPQKLQHLETTLIPQLRIIMEAANQSEHKSTLKEWLHKLKEAFYEAQDMLDLVEYERREKEVKAESSSKSTLALKSHFSSPQKKNLIKSLEKMEKLINEARDTLVPLFNLPSPSNNNLAVSRAKKEYRVTTSSPPPLVIGRDEDRNDIIKLLHDDSPESSSRSNCFSVIGVYGVGGSGKTTLAQYVCEYERKAEHFDLVMWVYVSREFDVNTILSKMFESASGENCADYKNLDVLQNKVKERLSGKKFLLVLDDVWCNKGVTRDEFYQLYSPLRVGKRGSKILVTTRMEVVANIFGASNPIQLREFDNDQFLRLFMHYAFGDTVIDDKNLEVELKNIGKKIAEKLHKSPLAARTVAGQLSKRLDSTFWKSMLRKNLLNDTMGALLLSYQHLEPHLQRCFAFFSLFPKGYIFKHDNLLDLWIAEQFIETEDTSEYVRDVASVYLFELISSSFLQHEKKWGQDRYSVHDLLHDLAENITENEYFRIENDERREIPIQVRHLFINVNMQREHIEKIYKLEGLRTIIISHAKQTVVNIDDVYALFMRLQKLHVFSLDVYFGSEAYFPKSIGYLKHLRYLKLIIHDTNWKPEWKLETLNKLYNLCFLYIDREFYSKISNIGSLTSIQTIPEFYVEKKRGFELKQLEKLRDLSGSLEILNLENVNSKEEARAAQLSNKVGLRELEFYWGCDDKSKMRNSDVEILEGLYPPPQITRIDIRGYQGGRYPSWISEMCSSVNKLEQFNLRFCTYLESLPEHLEMLTHLTFICIGYLPSLKMWQPLPINLTYLWLYGCYSLVFISKIELEMIMLSRSVQMSQVVTFLVNSGYQGACGWQFRAVESMIKASSHSSKQTISIPDPKDLQNCTMKRLDLIWQLSDVNNKLILPSSLETLHLDSCSLTNNILWEGLQGAAYLRDLRLKDIITITSIPKEVLSCLKELRELRIVHCLLLTSLGGLEALFSLTYLDIDCCPILTLDTTTTLPPSLRNLRLTTWRPPADILGGLASLEELYVDTCSSFGTEQVEVFQHCSSLKHLTFINCKAHSLPANLLSFTSLKYLYIAQYENLSVLPDLPASLQKIIIKDCNKEFMKSCKESGHPNCLKLAHIPLKDIY